MSAHPSDKAVCAIADAALGSPVYHSLAYLTVARFAAEQGMLRSNDVQDDAFARFVPSGERMVEVTLEGLSTDSTGEQLLTSGMLLGVKRLVRFDTAQGVRLEGSFWVTRLSVEAAGERFERIRTELRSDGVVTIV